MAEIGIVIPVYNGERFLEETLESVLAQTVTDWELVLVDDGSTDGSSAILETFAARDSRIYVVHQANGGVAAARNAGMSYLSIACTFVALLDQDDLWYPESLQILRQALLSDPAAAGVHGALQHIDGEGRRIEPFPADHPFVGVRRGFAGGRPVRWPAKHPTTLAVIVYACPSRTPGQMLLRRDAMAAAGDFDPKLAGADDWDMWFRLTERGYLAYVDRVVLDYRRHEGNVSLQSFAMVSVQEALFRKRASLPTFTAHESYLHELRRVWMPWLISQMRWIWVREHLGRRDYRKAIKESVRMAKELSCAAVSLSRFYATYRRQTTL